MNSVEIINCNHSLANGSTINRLTREGYNKYAQSNNTDDMYWSSIGEIAVDSYPDGNNKEIRDLIIFDCDSACIEVRIQERDIKTIVIFRGMAAVYFYCSHAKKDQILILRK